MTTSVSRTPSWTCSAAKPTGFVELFFLVVLCLLPRPVEAQQVFVEPSPPPAFDVFGASASGSVGEETMGGSTWAYGRLLAAASASRRVDGIDASVAYNGGVHLWAGLASQDMHSLYVSARPKSAVGPLLGIQGSFTERWIENSFGLQWRPRFSRIRPWASAEVFTLGGEDEIEGSLRCWGPLAWTGVEATVDSKNVAALAVQLQVPVCGGRLPPTSRLQMTWGFDPHVRVALRAFLSVSGSGNGEPLYRLGIQPGNAQTFSGEWRGLYWLHSNIGLFGAVSAYRRFRVVPVSGAKVMVGVTAALTRRRLLAKHTFETGPLSFRLQVKASEVTIVGSFTDWEPVVMRRVVDDWTVDIDVDEGVHRYVYVADGELLVPPEATDTITDEFGVINGLLYVD